MDKPQPADNRAAEAAMEEAEDLAEDTTGDRGIVSIEAHIKMH